MEIKMAALLRHWRKVRNSEWHSLRIVSSVSLDNQVRCGGSLSTQVNLLDLNKRGLFESVFPDTRIPELIGLLSSPQSLYCGFDPTANSLHIGNLLSLIVLLHGRRAGHSPIGLVGGATALLGDPSGKIKDRVAMTAEDVENNILGITENIERIVRNHDEFISSDGRKLPDFRIVNNRDWYKNKNVISFLSTAGRHFRVGEMISRQSVKSRLNSKEGISCTEFLYQVFQAYDWLHLFEKYNCTLQVGGNDQMGNISSGFDLIHRVTKKCAFGLLVPLLLSPGGQKLGKSAGNSMWLSPSQTSPYELYQYFFNIPDSAVDKYLKLFTFLSLEEIDSVMDAQNASPDKRHGQKKLAEQVTLLVHGETGLASALRCSEALFGDAVSALTTMKLPELLQLFRDAPTVEVVLDPELTVIGLCNKIKCLQHESNPERIIRAGGLYINQQRVTDPDLVMRDGKYILSSNVTLVRVGKRSYHIVKWCS